MNQGGWPGSKTEARRQAFLGGDKNGCLFSFNRSTDTLGRQSGTAVSAVGDSTPEHFTNYGYGNSGRLATVTSPTGSFTHTYTPNSSLIASVVGPVHTVTNTWEPNRDVLDVKDNRIPSTSTPISRFDYSVNGINQRTQVQTTGSAFQAQPADWNWGYDALGQVITADSPTNTFDRAYEYDQIGNRKKTADGALVTTGSSATVYEANNLNQYSQISVPSVSSVVPIHDQDGNATSYPLPVAPTINATLVYDGENRLVSVTTGTTTVSYTYDVQSRRVARTESLLPLGEGQGEGAQHTLYLYDGWNCLAEYTLQNSNFTIHNSFTWGLDLSGFLQGAGGVGGLLSVSKHQAQGTTHCYPTYDGNGNISEYLTTTGSNAAHFEYDPFGGAIVASGANAADFEYRFSTKPVDPAISLYYYGYRWYDPETGRWLNRDPIEENGGVNLYLSSSNKCVNSFDVLGLSSAHGGALSDRDGYRAFGSFNEQNIEANYTIEGRQKRSRWAWGFKAKVVTDEKTFTCELRIRVPIKGKASKSGVNDAVVGMWKSGVKQVWSEKFKLCCKESPICCSNGRKIIVELDYINDHTAEAHSIQFYDSVKEPGEAPSVKQWPINPSYRTGISRKPTVSAGEMAAHEVGHFLGNPEEYFGSVELFRLGNDLGPARQPFGKFTTNAYTEDSVMNGVGRAHDRHYAKIASAGKSLLKAEHCTLAPINEPCL